MRLSQLLQHFPEVRVRLGQPEHAWLREVAALPALPPVRADTLYLHASPAEAFQRLGEWLEPAPPGLCLLTPAGPADLHIPDGHLIWLEYWPGATLPPELSARILRHLLTPPDQGGEQETRQELVQRLLTGHSPAPELLRQARELGLELGTLRQVILIGAEQRWRQGTRAPPTAPALAQVTRRAVIPWRLTQVYQVGQQVAVLLPGGVPQAQVAAALARALQQEFPTSYALAAIGEKAAQPSDLPRSFSSAQAALEVALEKPQGQRWVSFEEMRPLLLYREIKRHPDLTALIEGSLRPLLDFTGEYRHILISTLLAYLEHGRSPTRAAEALGVHPNTLKYRMKRISDHLDINTMTGSQFVLYYLAAQLNRE